MHRSILLAPLFLMTFACGVGTTGNESATEDTGTSAARVTTGPWGTRSSNLLTSDGSCRHVSTDLIEPGFRMPKSGNANKCVETTNFRPVIDLGDSETYKWTGLVDPGAEKNGMLAKFGLQDTKNATVIGNFGHIGHSFVVARIPDSAFDDATDAYYVIENFSVGVISASHGMLRFRFKKPLVELYNQSPASPKLVGLTQDLILSTHAITTRGASYDPLVAGLSGGMAQARGVYSLENKVQDVLVEQGHHVEQVRLNMTGAMMKTYFASFVKDSPKRFVTVPYHTTRDNCGTEILKVFHDAGFLYRDASSGKTSVMPLPESFDTASVPKVLWDSITLHILPDIFPANVREALKLRGLYSAEADNWTIDPAVQALAAGL